MADCSLTAHFAKTRQVQKKILEVELELEDVCSWLCPGAGQCLNHNMLAIPELKKYDGTFILK